MYGVEETKKHNTNKECCFVTNTIGYILLMISLSNLESIRECLILACKTKSPIVTTLKRVIGL